MKREVIELRPTQFAVGMREVEYKVAHIRESSEKKRDEYLEEHPVPVVLGPDKSIYMIDHHHLVRACWEAGVKKVVTKLQADLSHLKSGEFWKVMIQSHWAYLHDHFGNGPHSPDQLPADVRCMADDPYRSLAWEVKAAGGYEKSHEVFSEFRWAEFLRKKIQLEPGEHGFKKGIERALKLCTTSDAASLPGYKKG